jgi:hypothetical protein
MSLTLFFEDKGTKRILKALYQELKERAGYFSTGFLEKKACLNRPEQITLFLPSCLITLHERTEVAYS